MTGLVGASIVLVLLLLLNGLLADLPQSALAAVVIAAAISLIDLPALRRFLSSRRSAFWLSLVTSAGVIFFGVLQGIVVAIVLAVLLFFRRSWWPHGAVLGLVPGEGWHSVDDFPNAERPEGILVFRWEAPLFFANAATFRRTVRRLVRDGHCRAVVLQCEAITDVDVTAASVLAQLQHELTADGVPLVFAEVRSRLIELFRGYGLAGSDTSLDAFTTIDAAVDHLRSEHLGDDESLPVR